MVKNFTMVRILTFPEPSRKAVPKNPKCLFALTCLLLGPLLPDPVSAQTPPGTDIWVFPLASAGSSVELEGGIRATQRPGYDNQPHFLPGGRFLLYTAIDDAGQADIFRFDLRSQEREAVTRTAPESEYSATYLPSGDGISVIRVEADSTQRLWRFDLDGRNPRVVLPDIQPAGYHAWLDDVSLALFVLGSPSTLQVATAGPGPGKVFARNIGRSLYRIPSRNTISFVQWQEAGRGVIQELDPATGRVETIAPLLQGNEFYSWTPEGVLLAGQGTKLLRWDPEGDGEWVEWADLAEAGVSGISRIAVSPEGDRIAVVGIGS